MNRASSLVRQLGRGLRRFFLEPVGAEVALEFSTTAVVGARVQSKRGRLELRALASAPLREGALLPTLEDAGFGSGNEIREAVKSVLARLGETPSARAALVVPDLVARFRLFLPDEVGTDQKKRNEVIAFRMQKLLPFAPSELRVISASSRSPADPVLGIGFSASVLGAYEQLGQGFGLDVGSVETSSMALLRGLRTEGDAILVRHDPSWMTLTLTRNGWPLAIRSFDASVAARLDEARREIAATAVFWRGHLAGERLSGAFIHAADVWLDELSVDITTGFGRAPERVKPPVGLVVAGMPASLQGLAIPALAVLGAVE